MVFRPRPASNGMEQFVQHLRKKPEHIRQRILIAVMIVLMALVLVLWFGTLGNRFTAGKENTKSTASPFSMVKESIGNLLDKSNDTPAIQNPDQSVQVIPVQ